MGDEKAIMRDLQKKEECRRRMVAKGKSKEAREINFALDDIKAQIIKHYQRLSDREAFVTAEMVRNAYQGIGNEYKTLLGAYDKDNARSALPLATSGTQELQTSLRQG